MKSVVFAFLLLAASVNAAAIDASVNTAFVAEPLYFKYDDTTREFSTEVLNSGSLAYTAQFRTDVVDNNSIVFTAWSERKKMMPGNSGFFSLHWLPIEGNYTTRYRVYFSGEVNESFGSITVGQVPVPIDAFNLTLIDVFDSFIVLEVKGPPGNAVVIPHGFSQGSWFGQKVIELSAKKRFLLPYSSFGKEVKIAVMSENGKYLSKRTLSLEKGKDLHARLLKMIFSTLTP